MFGLLRCVVTNILNMEAANPSETLVAVYRGSQYHISGDDSLAVNNYFFLNPLRLRFLGAEKYINSTQLSPS
jgi:hypothetical protein